MEYSRSRVLGIANGSVDPESGLEKHFFRVCQGTARPLSAIECDWLQIVKDSECTKDCHSPENVATATMPHALLEAKRCSSPHEKANTRELPPIPSNASPLIGFRASHKTLGDGTVVRVVMKGLIKYIVIRYDNTHEESEYSEDIFAGWGGYFVHSTAEAKRALTDFSPYQTIQQRHKTKVEEAGKVYLGVRSVTKGRGNRVAHCYSCKSELDNSIDLECLSCGWILCSCGACGCGFRGFG